MMGNNTQVAQPTAKACEAKVFSVRVTALSPIHLGSGKGDVAIDAEVVHDACGLPYFPAKRFKGLLYESALEIAEIMGDTPLFCEKEIRALFRHGSKTETGAQIIVSNLRLQDYETMHAEWVKLEKCYPELIQPQDVLEAYTSLRYQTQIDDKMRMAAENTLHNMRVVDKDVVFEGDLELRRGSEKDRLILAFAVRNLERAGLKRNRGFGRIRCELLNPDGTTAEADLMKDALEAWKEGMC